MKKLFAHIFTIFSLLINTCSSQVAEPVLNSQPQKVDWEYVNFSRINKAVKKYEKLQSKAKWIKCLKYFAIGSGCTVLGILILKYFFTTQDKPKNKIDTPMPEKEFNEKDANILKIQMELKEIASRINRQDKEASYISKKQEENFFIKRIKKGSLKALQFVIYTAVAASLWAIINKSGNLLDTQFGGIDLDSDFYKQKGSKINELIKQLGIFLVQHEQKAQDLRASKFFDLMFADILINHTSLIRWFEDLIGFIKCMVISSNGRDSLEAACLEKDILSLSKNLNQFTDKISCVFNSCSDAQEHSNLVGQATTSYLSFCRQFSKFIYDCGLYLYEENFLQENSLQN